MKGYPMLEATGVPAAQRWLLEATLSKRENHLDDMLGKYQNLMDLMRIYSNEKGQDADFSVTHADVQEALGPIHQSIAVVSIEHKLYELLYMYLSCHLL